MKRIISGLVLIFAVFILQISIFANLKFGNISPNIVILLPIFFGLFKGKRAGMFAGAVSGFFYDLYVSDLLGFSMLIYTLAGYVSGRLFGQFDQRRFLIPMLIVGGFEFAYGFLWYVVKYLLYNRIITGYYIMNIIIPELIYTLIVAFVSYMIVLLFKKIFDKRKEKEYFLSKKKDGEIK